MARDVAVDAGRKAELRMQLMVRHRELHATGARPRLFQRPAKRVKPLAFLGLPGLAAAVALSVSVWGLPLSGPQNAQAAEAARITRALAQTIPTVTGWQWTVHGTIGKTPYVIPRASKLNRYQQISIHYNRVYLYSAGKWLLISPSALMPVAFNASPAQAATNWQWAFAALPSMLQRGDVRFLPDTLVAGHRVEGIRYSQNGPNRMMITATAWIDPRSGLLSRIEQVVTRGKAVLGRDTVDFRYRRAR